MIICLAIGGLLMSSCEDYLDVSPEAGLTEEEVFEKYVNFKAFFTAVYDGSKGSQNHNIRVSFPLYFNMWDQKTTMNYLTDIADMGRDFNADVKRGQMLSKVDYITYSDAWQKRPIWNAMFRTIRVANLALQNVHRVQDAPSARDVEDLRGQAYFVRAYCHFILACYWGSMPYLDKAITGDDAWDYPRLSKNETFRRCANDLDSAFTTFKNIELMRRDPAPGQSGHLEDPMQHIPAGVAAKALKARVLLYAASPLNNANGTKDYEDAAVAAWEAIQVAKENNYSLIPMSEYWDNSHRYTNEQIWAWELYREQPFNGVQVGNMISGIMKEDNMWASGESPTQEMVDMYETQQGDALNTEADREIAAKAGHYNEQDPYTNRDPRFYSNVFFNQAPIAWPKMKYRDEEPNRINFYTTRMPNGSIRWSTHMGTPSWRGRSHTGYYARKVFGELNKQNQFKITFTDPLIRLAELYLNYAEAANEAYGPTGKAPGANLSAVDAINVVRERAQMPGVLSKYTTDTETFRERIRNERTVEFDQEGSHRYFDIRRWMIAPQVMNATLHGVEVEKVDVSDEYPTGFRYTRIALEDGRQPKWSDVQYYFPLKQQDYYKFKLFDVSLNPVW